HLAAGLDHHYSAGLGVLFQRKTEPLPEIDHWDDAAAKVDHPLHKARRPGNRGYLLHPYDSVHRADIDAVVLVGEHEYNQLLALIYGNALDFVVHDSPLHSQAAFLRCPVATLPEM